MTATKPRLRGRQRALLAALLTALLSVIGLGVATSPAFAGTGNMLPPFDIGTTWNICQGYNNPYPGTHNGSSAYGLDLTGSGCNNDAAGRHVLAPISGTLAYAYEAAHGNVCVNITGSNRSYTLTHIFLDNGFTGGSGSPVAAGQWVGTVAPAEPKGSYPNNNNLAHLHFQMWDTLGCWNGGSAGIPFDTAHSSHICGAPDLPSGGPVGVAGQGQWSGTPFVGASCDTPNYKAGIVIHNPGNTWSVALSNGSSFPTGYNDTLNWDKGDWTGLADVTGDGKADVVVHNSGNWNVAVNNGSGSFGAAGSGIWLLGWGAGDWAGVADVNGDGKADIVIHNPGNTWSVALSNGTSFPTGYNDTLNWDKGDWTGLADVTGDGKADIIVHNSNNWNVAVNDGTGHFGAAGSGPWLLGWGAGDWAGLADVNGDKKADIVIHNPGNTWSVALSNGGSFPAGYNDTLNWGRGDWTGLADVTGDGKADVIVHDGTNWNVAVNNGSGSFGAAGSGTWLSGWGAGDWAGMADVNGS